MLMNNRDVTAGTAPGRHLNSGPVFRMPLFGFAQLVLAAVAVGVAAGMVEDFKSQVRARINGPSPVAGLDVVHARLSEVAVESRTATLLLLDAARAAMARLSEGRRSPRQRRPHAARQRLCAPARQASGNQDIRIVRWTRTLPWRPHSTPASGMFMPREITLV